jgi:hypothetical protein
MLKSRKYKYLAKVTGVNRITGATAEIWFKLKTKADLMTVLCKDYPNVIYQNHRITEIAQPKA